MTDQYEIFDRLNPGLSAVETIMTLLDYQSLSFSLRLHYILPFISVCNSSKKGDYLVHGVLWFSAQPDCMTFGYVTSKECLAYQQNIWSLPDL